MSVAFVHEKELSNKDKETISAYRHLIAEFLQVTGRKFPTEITQEDVLEFCYALRQRRLSERTVMNYFSSICTFLTFCKVDHKKLVKKENRPVKIDDDPTPYTAEELKRFMAALTSERHRLFFEFLLKTGCREREACCLEWTDIDWDGKVVVIPGEKNIRLVVDGNEKIIHFKTKTRRSRTISIETNLLAKLKQWRQQSAKSRFPFGTKSDLPDGHFLGGLQGGGAPGRIELWCVPIMLEDHRPGMS